MTHLLLHGTAWAADGGVRITDVATWGILVAVALALAAGARFLQRWISRSLEPTMQAIHQRQLRPARLQPWTRSEPLPELLPGRLHHHAGAPAQRFGPLVLRLVEAGYSVAVSGEALLDLHLEPPPQAPVFRAPDGADPALLARLADGGLAALLLDHAPDRELKDQAERSGVALIVLSEGDTPRGAHPWGAG